ncbi:MAG: polyphosphate kinase 2 family protein [Burkholderiales bacterium]
MKKSALVAKLSRHFRVDRPRKLRLKDCDPDDTLGYGDEHKPQARELLRTAGATTLAELQDKLYAQDRWSVLLVFQAMDAAGKDGTIKHVMSGVNPQGCEVHSFKAPSSEELDHDYLWRSMRALPRRGNIGIFNRSYYEEVLVVRVHDDILKSQMLPPRLVTPRIWKERYEDINAFERYLARNGTVIRKFFLNVSRKEQKRRFMERLDQPEKNWKFAPADVREREYWDDYMGAYEDMIRATSTDVAPWYVIPADNKWFTRVAVAAVIIETLAGLGLQYPKVDAAKRAELKAARALLLGNNGRKRK